MAYTSEKPELPVPIDELRVRIPGWGADLDPKDRPSVPREIFDPGATGAHWDFPERQEEKWPRERSIEPAVAQRSRDHHNSNGGIRMAERRHFAGRLVTLAVAGAAFAPWRCRSRRPTRR